jgi:chromosome segregation ATPase
MADYIKSKGIAGIKMSQEVNKESYEKSIQRLKRELEEISSKVNSAKELLMNEETKTESVRKEHKKKSDDLVRFQSEERSLALLIQSNKEKIDEQNLTYSKYKIMYEKDLEEIRETLAKEKQEIENFETLNKDNLKTIDSQNEFISKLVIACDFGKKSLAGFEQKILDKKKELEKAQETISTARLIEIGLEKREVSLSKKEDVCEVRRRSLERMYKRKLGINLNNKFYGKNI